MVGEEVELLPERGPNPVEGIPAGDGQLAERPLELGGALAKHGRKQPALRVEVVKQQLLVHTGPARDPGYARTVEAVLRELFARRGDDP